MSNERRYRPGEIVWQDLTVPNAEKVSRFYERVAGWKRSLHPGCDDYNMTPGDTDEPVAGVCYATGSNAAVPPQWLLYVTVEDVPKAAAVALEQGGRVLDGPRPMGGNQFCVVQDPAGAVIGLISCEPISAENDSEN